MASLPPSAARSLAFPFGYGSAPIAIGGVTLQAEEGPDVLAVGAEQRTKVVELVGGGRVILTLGTQPDNIEFTGAIWGPNVVTRVAALRQLRDAGVETSLTWKSESYRGVLTKFTPKFGAIDAVFDVSFAVSRSTNGTLASAKPPTVDGQVSSMLTDAQIQQNVIAAVTTQTIAQKLQTNLDNIVIAIEEAGPLAQLAGPGLTSLINVIEIGVAGYQAFAKTLGPSDDGYAPAARATTLLTLVAANAAQGQSASSIQVQGGSYLEDAATAYGDADLGLTLADINGSIAIRRPGSTVLTVNRPPLTSGSV